MSIQDKIREYEEHMRKASAIDDEVYKYFYTLITPLLDKGDFDTAREVIRDYSTESLGRFNLLRRIRLAEKENIAGDA